MDSLLALIIDLHLSNARQGPGRDDFSQQALDFTQLDQEKELQIADIGCGSGSQSIFLAKQLQGTVYAVDLYPPFLQELERRSAGLELKATIETLEGDMANLPFSKNSLDLIWAESSIYNIGFKTGLSHWKNFLKPGGYMVVSELSWLRDRRPKPIAEYWKLGYPGIQNIAGNIQTICDLNLISIAHFGIDEAAWLDDFYQPLAANFDAFLKRHPDSPDAESIVDQEINEMELYRKYKDYYNYVFYIIQKPY